MKRVVIKRLMYQNLMTGEIAYGGTEYDGTLTDENILGCIHEVGKSIYREDYPCLILLRNGLMTHRVTVEEFPQYQKCWYDLLLDALRRI